MKYLAFALFFLTFFGIWFGANFYVYHRGMQALPSVPWIRILFTVLIIFLSTSYILVRFVERLIPDSPVLHLFVWPGSFWFAGLMYSFLLVLLIDLLRLTNHFIPFFPAFISDNPLTAKKLAFLAVTGITMVLLLVGYINARTPVVRHLTISITKSMPKNPFRVALVTDMHFGILVGKNQLEKLTNILKNEKPDLIVFGGDLMDEIQQPVLRNDIGSPLRTLSAPYGIYAVTGNHEYIGGVEKAVQYIESLGIRVLRDSVANIGNFFWLAGREDRDIKRFNGKKRIPLNDILAGIDRSKPLLLVDHQPLGLNEAVEAGVDLQLSGHTHHGQLWPFSLIVKRMYEVSHGYLRKGNTQFYVSNGYGTWGPPVRIGNRPEVAIITLESVTK